MKAIVVTNRWTGTLTLSERPAPRPGPGELLVRVRAAGVNPVDWKMRSGLLGATVGRGLPEVPGIDVAGRIEAVGPRARPDDANAFASGMRIVGFANRGGAWAELVVVARSRAARLPDEVGFVEAAAMPVAGLTALQALRNRAGLAAGARLLVNGASGGVGTFAVQLGRILGAHVTAVTSGPNADLVKRLGAERVVDYTREDFTRSPDQYDVILDAVASRTFAQCRPCLAPKGTYITTLPGGSNLAWSALARLGAAGGRQVVLASVQPESADLAYLAKLVAQGELRPTIEGELPLAEASDAVAQSRGGHVHGKLVLTVGGD